jgi:hypothetical protein
MAKNNYWKRGIEKYLKISIKKYRHDFDLLNARRHGGMVAKYAR